MTDLSAAASFSLCHRLGSSWSRESVPIPSLVLPGEALGIQRKAMSAYTVFCLAMAFKAVVKALEATTLSKVKIAG